MSRANRLREKQCLIKSHLTILKITCGVISPNTTINNVEKTIAIKPDVKLSSNIVNVELTKTFPNKMLHSKKLPWSLTGWIARAYRFSASEPVLHKIYNSKDIFKYLNIDLKKIITFKSVLSKDINPKLSPLRFRKEKIYLFENNNILKKG